jgi:putative aminopeptidase FrvX
MHTPIEVLDLRDLNAAAKLLAAFVTALTPQADFIPR